MKSLPILLLLFLHVRSISISDNCPKQCECELQLDNTVAVYCNRGGINDTNFYRILETAPVQTSLLEIIGSGHRPNNFRWNDNLNRFTQLRTLRLLNCEIPALSQSMHMKSLKQLDLSYNQIDSIQINAFKGLNALEELSLSHNKITVLPSGAFIYLKRLRHLAIAYNKFSELPSSFLRGPANLEQLELDGSSLDQTGQINNLFNDVPNLKRLELNFCSLDDQKIAQLQLDKVPLIRRLGLSGNNLTEVPSSSFRALAHLEIIDLRHNQIRRIQPCAFCSCNITTVLLGHNLLGVNPKSINTEAFADVSVKEIDLSYNFFDEFESRLLGYAEVSVESLDLSGNALPTLKPVYTLTLPSLTRLHMADNKFGELPPVMPPEYSRLKFLNLSRNELTHLPDSIESYLNELRSLDLSNNLFESIPEPLVKSFVSRLDKVFLHHNPWDCRCAVQSLQEIMLQKYMYRSELRYGETLCDQPELLRNQPIHRVKHITDCAIFFGASYGLSQASELFILLGIVLAASTLIAIIVILFLYCGHGRKSNKNGFTAKRTGPAARLKHGDDTANFINTANAELVGSSMNSSMLSEPLTHSASASISSAHDLPPPLPKTSPFLLF